MGQSVTRFLRAKITRHTPSSRKLRCNPKSALLHRHSVNFATQPKVIPSDDGRQVSMSTESMIWFCTHRSGSRSVLPYNPPLRLWRPPHPRWLRASVDSTSTHRSQTTRLSKGISQSRTSQHRPCKILFPRHHFKHNGWPQLSRAAKQVLCLDCLRSLPSPALVLLGFRDEIRNHLSCSLHTITPLCNVSNAETSVR